MKFKYDGYRLIVQRDGARVRLFSRNGLDRPLSLDRRERAEESAPAIRHRWRGRHPRRRRHRRLQRLHSRQHDDEGAALRLDVCRRHLNKINDLRIGSRIEAPAEAPSRKGSAGFFEQPQR